jgi:hypothetical protein
MRRWRRRGRHRTRERDEGDLWQGFESLDELLQVASREVFHAQVEIVLTLESKLESRGEGMRGTVGHGMEDVSLSHGLSLVGMSHILLADNLQSI